MSNLESIINVQKIINPKKTVSKEYVDRLTEITRNGFGSEITREDVEHHVLDVDELYLVKENDHLIGFASYDNLIYDKQDILYLSGMVIDPEHQGKGIFGRVNSKIIKQESPDLFAMRTQNPAIYSATAKLSSEIYPNNVTASSSVPSDIQSIGNYIAKEFLSMDNFNQNNLVSRNTYGHSLYGSIPEVKTKSFFDSKLTLDYDKGDSIILVAKPDYNIISYKSNEVNML